MKTNKEAAGIKTVTNDKLLAYFGLEMAMPIIQLNGMEDYWSEKMFLGVPCFRKVMGRDRFLDIRARLQIKPTNSYQHEVATTDPLWMIRQMMNSFLKNSASVAVGTGAMALDETTICTKAYTTARSYIPTKPDPYGIRFYALCVWKSGYVYSLFDNNSGKNKTGISQPVRFTEVF